MQTDWNNYLSEKEENKNIDRLFLVSEPTISDYIPGSALIL